MKNFDCINVPLDEELVKEKPDYVSSHLDEESIKNELNTSIVGKRLVLLETVTSTNDFLKALAKENCKNGTVVATREQTKGKGRLGRKWLSKKDDSIIFSVILFPDIQPEECLNITLLSGLAVCKAIREELNIDCKIKWPNDIIINNKKLGGILSEMSASGGKLEYIIVGIGINAEQRQFPKEISHKATSLFCQSEKAIDKNRLFAKILKSIEDEFMRNNLELTGTALEEYTSLCATVGREISFFRGEKRLCGKAVGIEPNGELAVKLEDETVCSLGFGEVTVQGIY